MKAEPNSPYPLDARERDRWIVAQRPARSSLDPRRPYEFFVEPECFAGGQVGAVATVFLTNRECPWRCAMCDLWRHTLSQAVPRGAIPEQIAYALGQLPPARQIKLYNSGSFFDRHAIPVEDYPAIAARAGDFERTIVESHPALIGDLCLRFRDLLSNQLEVAMGLETADPAVLARLNKGMTLAGFAAASASLKKSAIELRVFLLIEPPFMKPEEAPRWAESSIDFAFDCGATAVTLIPTRGGNGAMEIFAQAGDFAPPRLAALERAASYGLGRNRGRVFVDLWDLHSSAGNCPECYGLRLARLQAMNLGQLELPPVPCSCCQGES